MQMISEPVATLYIYKLNGRAVAIGLGQVPPDPLDLAYDSLVRVPIMANGDEPIWRTFTWYPGESIANALKRAGNPVPKKRFARKPVRYGEQKPPQPVRTTQSAPLGTLPDGRRYIRDRRTGQFILEDKTPLPLQGEGQGEGVPRTLTTEYERSTP